ncbi:MAG: DUF1622 domain-containing protein [Verrucomicrobiota bacterium]
MNRTMQYLHYASFGIGVSGVLVIVFGVAGGLWRFVRAEWCAVRGGDVDEDRKRLRHVLGYYLLLGLEFLIAADVIDTLMKPSAQDLIVLGAIVLIRTVISCSLNAELKSEKQELQPGVPLVGTSRCDVPARIASDAIDPSNVNAIFQAVHCGPTSDVRPRTAQRAVPACASL